MILYKFNEDGIYSSVEKHEMNNGLAKELLSESDGEYFKSFSKAKAALNKYIKGQLTHWRYALSDCKELTESTVNDYTK